MFGTADVVGGDGGILKRGISACLAGSVRHLELLVMVMAEQLMPFAALFMRPHPGAKLIQVPSFCV
jgi:hypothetical protein